MPPRNSGFTVQRSALASGLNDAARALHDELVRRELRDKQAREDALLADDRELQRARIQQQMEIAAAEEARRQEQVRISQEQADRVRRLDEATIARRAGKNTMMAEAFTTGQISPANANTITAMYAAEGEAIPDYVQRAITAPKPEAPVKLERFEHDGDLMTFNPVTGETRILKHARPKSTERTPEQELNTTLKAIQIEERRDKLDTARAERAKSEEASQARASELVADIDALLADTAGMDRATGSWELRGGSQAAIDWNARKRRVVAGLTLPNLGTLKGPMSDRDVAFVKSIATILDEGRLSKEATIDALMKARQRMMGDNTPSVSVDRLSELMNIPSGRKTAVPGVVAPRPIRSSK